MIEEKLKEKIGEKLFRRAQLIAENRFGYKANLISKYYQSIYDGYISLDEEWSDESIISILKNKFDKASHEDKISFINEIMWTYDEKDGKTKYILEKYHRALKKNLINNL
jgi:hypothetical protein